MTGPRARVPISVGPSPFPVSGSRPLPDAAARQPDRLSGVFSLFHSKVVELHHRLRHYYTRCFLKRLTSRALCRKLAPPGQCVCGVNTHTNVMEGRPTPGSGTGSAGSRGVWQTWQPRVHPCDSLRSSRKECTRGGGLRPPQRPQTGQGGGDPSGSRAWLVSPAPAEHGSQGRCRGS